MYLVAQRGRGALDCTSSIITLDFSPTMLAQVGDRFRDDPTVTVVAHNLDQPLPDWAMVRDGPDDWRETP
ncbi:MAG: hypothetical protein EA366_11475 [Spirulina sp. DLM2.Bin59]|nr:MAG: hypothetical protein EA366_11475 [Spirulina sp. DLM2.Bin59]